MMKPIILIGMMGSGKTTIGKALSSHLSLSWIDTDQYIEQQEQQSISHLFAKKGEAYFRLCETKALQTLMSTVDVISTGGGIIVTPINREMIKDKAFVIYLKTSIPTLVARIDPSNRPLLQDEDMETKLTTLYETRQKLYEECAHLTIETSSLSIQEVVHSITDVLSL